MNILMTTYYICCNVCNLQCKKGFVFVLTS